MCHIAPVVWKLKTTMTSDTPKVAIERGTDARGATTQFDVPAYDSSLAFNLTWQGWLKLRSLCDMPEAIAKADFARQAGGCVKVTRELFQFTIVRPGETVLPKDAPETLVAAQ